MDFELVEVRDSWYRFSGLSRLHTLRHWSILHRDLVWSVEDDSFHEFWVRHLSERVVRSIINKKDGMCIINFYLEFL